MEPIPGVPKNGRVNKIDNFKILILRVESISRRGEGLNNYHITPLAQLDHFFGGAQTFRDLLIKLGPSRLIPLVRLILSFSLTSHILRFL